MSTEHVSSCGMLSGAWQAETLKPTNLLAGLIDVHGRVILDVSAGSVMLEVTAGSVIEDVSTGSVRILVMEDTETSVRVETGSVNVEVSIEVISEVIIDVLA